MGFQCGVCGKEHDELPMDLAFMKPEAYFKVPEAQRARRVTINDDLCSIDNKTFFVRGLLPLPVNDTDQYFGWGVWAQVSKAAYKRYIKLWQVDGSAEPPFDGNLSATMPGYPDTNDLEVALQLGDPSQRPTITVKVSDHPLYKEQTEGITMARVHDILETAMPHLFKGKT
jgi:hypothetical protein